MNCPVCRGNNYVKIRERNGYIHSRCSQCDLIFVSSSPKNYSTEVYDEDYYFFDPKRQGEDISRAKKLISLVNRYCPKEKRRGKLLDVGCGKGYFLQLARKEGYHCVGIEPSEKATGYGKNKYNLEIVNNTIGETFFARNTFDIITMWEVLEHLSNPLYVKEKLMKWLNEDGLLFLSTPNTHSMCSKIFGVKCGGGIYDIPMYHIACYSPTTLKYLFKDYPISIQSICLNFSKLLSGIVDYSLLQQLLKVKSKYLLFSFAKVAKFFLLPLLFLQIKVPFGNLNPALIAVIRKQKVC